MRKIRFPNSVTIRQAQEILNGFEYKLNEILNFDRTDSLPVTDPQEHYCAQYSIRKQDFGRSYGNQGFPTFYDHSDDLLGYRLTFRCQLNCDSNFCVGMNASERYATVRHTY